MDTLTERLARAKLQMSSAATDIPVSQSFRDVAALEAMAMGGGGLHHHASQRGATPSSLADGSSASLAAAVAAQTTPALPPLSPTGAAAATLHARSQGLRSSSAALLGGATPGALRAIQEDEDDPAEVVIVCEPEGATLMMGGLHPRGSLYERPVNIESARLQHAHFRQVLREHGVRVLTVREILAFGADSHMGARADLEDLAMTALTYVLGQGTGDTVEDTGAAAAEAGAGGEKDGNNNAAPAAAAANPPSLDPEDAFYLTDDYKRSVLEAMSVTQLIDIILINPTVTLTPSGRDTGLTASYTFQPLSNLVYTRDQQITTGKGIVMGRLRSPQRQREVELMRFCLRKLGMPIIGCIGEGGFLEGGDFFPMGPDLALVGVGLRSNVDACRQLMDNDLLGARRLGVVRDDFDRSQDRMHLDCVFSVLGKGLCLMLEDIIGEQSAKRRLVDEWVRDPSTGKYSLARCGVEFAAFMRGEGYRILPISHEEQLQYACNVLNLGNGRVISVHPASARRIVRHEAFRGDVRAIDFSSVTSMYGSVHCASQVVKRAPRRGLAGAAAVPAAAAGAATTGAAGGGLPRPVVGGMSAAFRGAGGAAATSPPAAGAGGVVFGGSSAASNGR
jgi:arginine deiminase